MAPQSAVPAGTPSPRKLRDASVIIMWPISIAAITDTTLIALGRIWRATIQSLEAPMLVAASTYSRSLITRTWARVTLAYGTQPLTPRTTIRLVMPGPTTATRASARTNTGTLYWISASRITAAPTTP